MKIVGNEVVREKFWVDEAKHPKHVLPDVVGENVCVSESLTKSKAGARDRIKHRNAKPNACLGGSGGFSIEAGKVAEARPQRLGPVGFHLVR